MRVQISPGGCDMIRIDVTLPKSTVDASGNSINPDWTFRTNNDGSYLFVGTSENSQISCKSGFGVNRQTKTAIREYLAFRLRTICPRLKYTFHI